MLTLVAPALALVAELLDGGGFGPSFIVWKLAGEVLRVEHAAEASKRAL